MRDKVTHSELELWLRQSELYNLTRPEMLANIYHSQSRSKVYIGDMTKKTFCKQFSKVGYFYASGLPK